MKMISVIVPIYNKEKYLKSCINSIINQTYKDLEILLIDDGSTDDSFQICKNYQQLDQRIRVISKENGGVSSARNLGLENCKGSYFAFIDPDDYVNENYFFKLLNCIKENDADIAYCYAIDSDEKSGETVTASTNSGKCLQLSKENYDWCSPDAHKVAWGALYRKDKLKEIRFDEDLTIAEDTLYFARCIQAGCKIVCLDEALYHYVNHAESLTNKAYSGKNKTELIAWDRICSLFRDNKNTFLTAKSEYAQTCKKIAKKYYLNENYTKIENKFIRKKYRKNAPYLLKYAFAKKKMGLAAKTIFSALFWNVWLKTR